MIAHDPELPAWLALRRVHRGGITRVRSGYVDRGQRIPGYIADALDTLVPAGLVTFGEPDPAGYRQVVLTSSGQARLAELSTRLDDPRDPATTIEDRPGAVTHSWALSPTDHRSHVIDDGLVFTRCGQYLPSTIPTSPTAGPQACSLCTAILLGGLVPPPEFGSP